MVLTRITSRHRTSWRRMPGSLELVGGADTLVDQSPIASNEAGNSSDIVWQGDGSGNYDYNDYGGSDYDNSYDNNSYDNSYDSGNDYEWRL